MKTGQAAKLFGVDNKTITDWVDRFAEFFTEPAKKDGRIQRKYEVEDLYVLNTIRSERSQSTEWGEIQAKLASGYRDLTMPPQYTNIEGERAIAVYAELSGLKLQLETERQEKERLRQELQAEREKNSQLNREVGKWQALYEMLKDQNNDK